jgi:hypothetical protein
MVHQTPARKRKEKKRDESRVWATDKRDPEHRLLFLLSLSRPSFD